ncbi:MAG: PQQ-dependent sugar dehydrogenase [Ignavibacteria bacterium]|nr:PQQ-dependent sugar dehydrogenase [Ignavibacteria bacterium]
MRRAIAFMIIAIHSLTCNVTAQTTIQVAFPNLTFNQPVDIQHAGDNSDRLFVVSQSGTISVFQNDPNVTSAKVFLNITDIVVSGGERGLLGLAFHPDYENNGYFYINYTGGSPLKTFVSRFQVSTNPDSAIKSSELVLISFTQPYTNHNGGQVSFGPDGYLYIATGDGGSGGDPQSNGQNKSVLLGKILRIDVNGTSGSNNYSIPADNPFANNLSGWREEIFAYGLRNPWRFSFDPVTNWNWCADVGQNVWEEINIIQNGKNYGWKIMEGAHCYSPSTGCDTSGLTFPIFEYAHNSAGGYSVTGGFVYRGPNVPQLYGKYIYADYVSQKIWGLTYDGVNQAVNELLINSAGIGISSFGVDQYNELFICALSNGKIYKFTPTAQIISPTALRIVSNLASSVTLQWIDNSNNESGFVIERKIVGQNEYTSIDSTLANINEYEDTSVSPETNYIYRIRAYNSTSFSGYSNEVTVFTLVPVEMGSLNLKQNENKVFLNWTTFSETNNKGFEVFRMIQNDETHNKFGIFSLIGFVQGKGTTTSKNDYKFIDNLDQQFLSGKVFYKLKQIDYNGNYVFTDAAVLDFMSSPQSFELFQNFPNPFNPVTKIKFAVPSDLEKGSVISLKVYDVLGNEVAALVNEIKPTGIHTIEFDGSKLTSGIYFYKLQSGDFKISKKLLLLK